MSDNSCQIKSVFRGQKFIKKHCCREDAQIKTDNTEKLPDKEVRFCLFSQPFSLLSSEGGKKNWTGSFYRLRYGADAVAQTITDGWSSGVKLARCWSMWQGLSEIPALLSVWAGKNHVKPVLVRLPSAATIYGWSQGSCCSLALLHGDVVRILSCTETCLKECKIVWLWSQCLYFLSVCCSGCQLSWLPH